MTIAQLAAALALISTIGGGAWMLDGRYAKVEQVGSNAQAIALVRIEVAAQSGNRQRLIDLCNNFRKTHGWKPSQCP